MENKEIENYDQENDNQNENVEDEDFENDLYLVELHKRLVAMKKERKKAEQDASLLDNRLKLLKGEEDKTLKKIEVTRKKTHEKMTSLQKQEEYLRQKLEFKEQKERDVELKKEQNIKLKTEINLNTMMKREMKMKQIMEEASLLKAQKKNNEELLKYIKIEEMTNNKSRAEYIKNQQQMMEEKKRALELEKKNKIKNDLERKIFEEQRMKEDADNKLVNLEQEEIEIMKRIRTTTQVHKACKIIFVKFLILLKTFINFFSGRGF
jgi:hypothetical protein